MGENEHGSLKTQIKLDAQKQDLKKCTILEV